jgi:hypothetical protein
MIISTINIFRFCINILLAFCCFNAAAQDSIKAISKSADSIVVQSKKAKAIYQWMPSSYYIGIDPIKALYNTIDNNKQRYEAVVESYLKNGHWANVQIGYSSGKYNKAHLQYNTQSAGLILSAARTLFPKIKSDERDNAFIGIGYGASYYNNSNVAYVITDLWGTTSGSLNANKGIAHFAELNGGFRIGLTPRFMLGWRAQAKALLNNNTLNTIAPIYIANYGAGDKSSAFGWNFMLAYKLW